MQFQCVVEGVERFSETNLYTVFSCSNYCDRCQNKCGFIKVFEGNSFQAYALPPLPQIKRANTSMINVPTIFIPTFLLQKVEPDNTFFSSDDEPKSHPIHQLFQLKYTFSQFKKKSRPLQFLLLLKKILNLIQILFDLLIQKALKEDQKGKL